MKICIILMFLANMLFAGSGFQPASTCGECHEEIYQQWSASMHGKSTIQKDPLYRGMYEWAIKDTDGKLQSRCLSCHAPLSLVLDSNDPEQSFNQDGVTCQFCHGIRNISDRHSLAGVDVDLTTVYSSQPETDIDAHPTAHRDFFTKSDVCLPCHAEMRGPNDIEVCATGSEWNAFAAENPKTCQDCHMRNESGETSHLFPGTHQGNLLQNSVEMEMQFDEQESLLTITMQSIHSGHALPTGTPLRLLTIKVVGLNDQGETIWENWATNPMKEDKSALFMKILADSGGNGPVPPWQAQQIIYDRRLMPGTSDEITYRIDNDGIHKIAATLHYHFAPKPILKKFNITDEHFTKPRIVAREVIVF